MLMPIEPGDGLAQCGSAQRRGVREGAALYRITRGLEHSWWRPEIRFAEVELDDVVPLRLQGGGTSAKFHCKEWGNGLGALGYLHCRLMMLLVCKR